MLVMHENECIQLLHVHCQYFLQVSQLPMVGYTTYLCRVTWKVGHWSRSQRARGKGGVHPEPVVSLSQGQHIQHTHSAGYRQFKLTSQPSVLCSCTGEKARENPRRNRKNMLRHRSTNWFTVLPYGN